MCLTCAASKLTGSIRKVAPAGHSSRQVEDRDKCHVNPHIRVKFEDVLGEPGFDTPITAHDCVWINSYYCYNCWKNVVYRTASLITAFPVSLFFACLACSSAFCHIWVCTPCHRFVDLSCCYCLRSLNGMFWDCVIGPVAQACGNIFWAFRKTGKSVKPRGNKVSFNNKVKFKTIPPRKSKTQPLETFSTTPRFI